MEPTPPPLRPATPVPGSGPVPLGTWLAHHALGLCALVIGAVGFLVVMLQQEALWSQPDWRISVPFFVATLVFAVASIGRREHAPLLPVVGLGLAAMALVLGWALVMAIIVAVTAIIILILSVVM